MNTSRLHQPFQHNLAPDSAEISRFFGALFRYADEGTFVSLRVFH